MAKDAQIRAQTVFINYKSSTMKIRPDEKSNEKNQTDKLLDWTGKNYQSFRSYVQVNRDDSTLQVVFKGILSIFGLLIMLLLSPFLVLGLIIAFAAVF